jgi:hypothetical protein
MRALRPAINFFSLQPFFTLSLLRAFWWIYIFAWLFELYSDLYRRLGAMPGENFLPWFRILSWADVALLPLSAFVAIMAARLFIELIINRLSMANQNLDFQRQPRSAWPIVEGFIELTPFVTRDWLESFWRLFLIVSAWTVTANVVLGANALNSILGAVAYAAGVRLLIEAATRLLLPDTAAAIAVSDIRSPRYFARLLLLRPFLTRDNVKLFWWLYILVELHRLYLRLGTFGVPGSLPPSLFRYVWYNVAIAPFVTLIMIGTVHLLLEVLMGQAFGPLDAPSEALKVSHSPRTLAQDLSDFVNLRPFFTPARLQLFWGLFLLAILADVYSYISLVPGRQAILHLTLYIKEFLKPLYCVAGVRLLIEGARVEERRSSIP